MPCCCLSNRTGGFPASGSRLVSRRSGLSSSCASVQQLYALPFEIGVVTFVRRLLEAALAAAVHMLLQSRQNGAVAASEDLRRVAQLEVLPPTPRLLVDLCDHHRQLRGKKKREIKPQASEKTRWLALYQSGHIELAEIEPRLQGLRAKIKKLHEEGALVEKEEKEEHQRLQLLEQFAEFTQRMKSNLSKLSFAERKQVVRLLVEEAIPAPLKLPCLTACL